MMAICRLNLKIYNIRWAQYAEELQMMIIETCIITARLHRKYVWYLKWK